MTRRILDLAGQRYGRLTVVKQVGRRHRSVVWECVCDCGKKCRALGTNIAHGNTQSCGCLRREQSAVNAYRPRQKDRKANPKRVRPVIVEVPAKKWAGAEDAASTLAALMGLAA